MGSSHHQTWVLESTYMVGAKSVNPAGGGLVGPRSPGLDLSAHLQGRYWIHKCQGQGSSGVHIAWPRSLGPRHSGCHVCDP